MKLGILGGTGVEGCGIALRLGMGGLDVLIGSRSLERATATAEELNLRLGRDFSAGAGNEDVIESCQLLFLALPFGECEHFLKAHEHRWVAGQVLVDVTVPLTFEQGPRLIELSENSGSEYLSRVAPEHLPIVSAFKTLPAHLLCEIDQPLDCDEFVCSDSADAKQIFLDVARKIPGIRWVDAGPLRYSGSLEAMTLLAIGINRRYKVREGRFRFLGL